MIQRRATGDEAGNNIMMAKMCRSNQGCTVVDAGDEICFVAQLDGERHQLRVIGHRGNGQDIIDSIFKGVHVRAARSKRGNSIVVRGESGNMRWCSARPITGIQVMTLCDQAVDLVRPSFVGGKM